LDKYVRNVVRAFSVLKNLNAGVLPRRPESARKLNKGSRNGSQPPHAMSPGLRAAN
jgi:hypothetical protein